MAIVIDPALVTQFSDRIHMEAQQMKSRQRPSVILKPMTGDNFAYDGLENIEAREIVGRLQPADFDDYTFTRRQIARRRFIVNVGVDESDVRGMLADPKGELAQRLTMAMERQFDHIVFDAAFADVKTGRNFETTVTFANDGGATVDATAGLTYNKLLEITRNFIDNEVEQEIGMMIALSISGDEHESLMKETELTSGDFTRQFAVEGGSLVNAAGMNLNKYGASVTRPVIPIVSSKRQCMALAKNGICVGMSKDISLKVQERSDLIETVQIQAILEMGAVRTEGERIIKVETTP